jgi:hypothetical protein
MLHVIREIRDRGTPVLFDVDDLIFDPEVAAEIPALDVLSTEDAALWMEGVRRYRTTMEACDAFIASTPLLARHAESVVGIAVERFDNGVGLVLGRASDRAIRRPRSPGPLRIGYFSGTDTHDADWAHIEPAVIEVLGRHSGSELWLGGLLEPTRALSALGSRVRRLPFMDWRELPAKLRDLDVNLAPLVGGSRFNDAKSAIKWLEAALVATPTVASPTEPMTDAISDGVNGFLADSAATWAEALDRLLSDEGLRTRVGQRARRDALLRWSPHLQGARYHEILERTVTRITSEPAAPRAAGWDPVTVDDALGRRDLMPYEDLESSSEPGPVRLALLRERDRAIGIIARTRRSLMNDGLTATAKKAPKVFRRVAERAKARR